MPLLASSLPARIVLLGSVFLIAACGLVYELVAGAVSSYILGDAVTQFSLVIGVFLSSMGLGSYLAKYIRGNLLKSFIEIEIWIGLTGGLSSIVMFAVSAFAADIFAVIFYGLCILIGIMIGVEIPLLIRILKEDGDFSEALSHVLAIDYIGALAGAILFPFLVLPYLGLSRASIVFGIMNLVVAGVGLTIMHGRRLWIAMRLSAAGFFLFTALMFSASMVGFFEDLLYQDAIIFSKTTRYQRIILTRWRDDIRLYLNGNIQFSSVDEARYHEALVIPALEACARPGDILILGGGDGLTAREVLKYDSVRRIVLVDIDPVMTTIGRERPELRALNQNSLNSPKVEIVNTDAMKYVENSQAVFDAIIVDLPDPSSGALAKLYSKSFYALCARRLRAGGVLVTQATSPFFAPAAFWCIVKTVASAVNTDKGLDGLLAVPFHVNVPSFGEWGFVLAARTTIDPQRLTISVPTRFLNSARMRAMFSFGKDTRPAGNIEVNRLEFPVLDEYYKRGWGRFHE
ncbi:MAG: polyamine aminopropyltransferase [Desulfobacterales bacterium]|nr:polyamine aminopropyltransferase [Desulfobacterales bacterium]